MTRKSSERKRRDKFSFPPAHEVAAAKFDANLQKFVVIKRNVLTNQVYRDGAKIARSFDKLIKPDIVAASDLFSLSTTLLLNHLPRLDDEGFKATAARLLFSAGNSYTAAIQAARVGYPKQFGMLSRAMIEALATTITLAIKDDALQLFHENKLSSTKCVGWAKTVFEPIGEYYGMLSNDFVHIGKSHSYLEPPTFYKPEDEVILFLKSMIRGNAWLFYLVCEFIFHDDVNELFFWKITGENSVAYAPNDEVRAWIDAFIDSI